MASRSKNDDPRKAVALVLIDLAVSVGCCAFATYLANCLLKRLQNISSTTRSDPDDGSVNGQAIQKSLQWIVAKRGGNFTIPALTHRELQMAEEILHPDAIDASFAQIGGLDHIKQEIYDLAIFPLVNPDLFAQSKLRQPPRGILLCGKPGTGKTMLAKAIANEAEAVFIPLQLSKILNKYWGESNKLIAATFSLAKGSGKETAPHDTGESTTRLGRRPTRRYVVLPRAKRRLSRRLSLRSRCAAAIYQYRGHEESYCALPHGSVVCCTPIPRLFPMIRDQTLSNHYYHSGTVLLVSDQSEKNNRC
jgi:ATPase family associated with various cellular activities (AAA)